MIATILPIVFGALLIIGAALDIEYFLRFRGMRTIEALLGRTVQRIVVAMLGACMIASPFLV